MTNTIPTFYEWMEEQYWPGFDVFGLTEDEYYQWEEIYNKEIAEKYTKEDKNMTDAQLIEAFEQKGYSVIKVKHWSSSGDTYVYIRNRSKLVEASEFGRTLNVIVATPC